MMEVMRKSGMKSRGKKVKISGKTKGLSKSALNDENNKKENSKLENGSAISDCAEDIPTTPKKASISQNSQCSANITPSSKINLDSVAMSESGDARTPRTFIESENRVKKVYKIIQKCTGGLGGNGYNGAIYGELTQHSMQKVIDFLVDKCELKANSMFIDVGSGLGKPNFHVCQDPGVAISVGIELEEIRWQLAIQNLKAFLKEATRGNNDCPLIPGVNFINGDIFDAISTDPFTHVYMYDLGFPPPLQQKIAGFFNASTHAKYLVSYRPPRRVIHEYGYDVEEIGKMPTSMMGSGESHTAYFYKRTSSPASCNPRNGTSLIQVPTREGSNNDVLEFVCSNYFKECIENALKPVDVFSQQVELISNKILNSGRPKRTKKPRKLNI